MPTSYTDTEPSVVGTDYDQVEPTGAGYAPFGDPSGNKILEEYGRGFGDPKTSYTENNEA